MEKKNFSILQLFLVTVTFVAMVIVNIYANTATINGLTTREASNAFISLIIPANYTFYIWFLIYALLAVYILYLFGAFKNIKVYENLTLINFMFIALNLLNIGWLFAFHYKQLILSNIIIGLMMLAISVLIFFIRKLKLTNGQKLVIKLPFYVFFAWLTVAAFLQSSDLITFYDMNIFGLTPQVWTTLMLVGLIITFVIVAIFINGMSYVLVGTWAFVGILVRHLTTLDGRYLAIIITCIIGIALTLLTFFYLLYKNQDEFRMRDDNRNYKYNRNIDRRDEETRSNDRKNDDRNNDTKNNDSKSNASKNNNGKKPNTVKTTKTKTTTTKKTTTKRK